MKTGSYYKNAGDGLSAPNCASDFQCAKKPRIITKKQTCFQRFYIENRSARLLHKRLAAWDGKPDPYIISAFSKF